MHLLLKFVAVRDKMRQTKPFQFDYFGFRLTDGDTIPFIISPPYNELKSDYFE